MSTTTRLPSLTIDNVKDSSGEETERLGLRMFQYIIANRFVELNFPTWWMTECGEFGDMPRGVKGYLIL